MRFRAGSVNSKAQNRAFCGRKVNKINQVVGSDPVAIWSSELAIGDGEFTERIYRFLGRYVGGTSANEDPALYGAEETDISLANALEWNIYDEV